ncbi:MAG TPA: hypothetical protein VGF20_03985 [Candidatus Acidoferrum sp.]
MDDSSGAVEQTIVYQRIDGRSAATTRHPRKTKDGGDAIGITATLKVND